MSHDCMRVVINKRDVINSDIEHKYIICEKEKKSDILISFLKAQGENRGLIFCRTKADTQNVAKQLIARNINADSLNGDMLQKERDKVMRAFKNSKLRILVATDLAARGIDVKELAFVVHYSFPESTEYYTHRSGRTGRAGNKGLSFILITPRELAALKRIERELGIKIKENHR
jgi:ATP-dependent RNA helicase DeaD